MQPHATFFQILRTRRRRTIITKRRIYKSLRRREGQGEGRGSGETTRRLLGSAELRAVIPKKRLKSFFFVLVWSSLRLNSAEIAEVDVHECKRVMSTERSKSPVPESRRARLVAARGWERERLTWLMDSAVDLYRVESLVYASYQRFLLYHECNNVWMCECCRILLLIHK